MAWGFRTLRDMPLQLLADLPRWRDDIHSPESDRLAGHSENNARLLVLRKRQGPPVVKRSHSVRAIRAHASKKNCRDSEIRNDAC